MNKPLRFILASGFVAGVGYAAYTYLLTPEAKGNLKAAVNRAVEVGKSMTQKLNASDPSRQEEVRLEANRVWIDQQWKNAGY